MTKLGWSILIAVVLGCVFPLLGASMLVMLVLDLIRVRRSAQEPG